MCSSPMYDDITIRALPNTYDVTYSNNSNNYTPMTSYNPNPMWTSQRYPYSR